MERGSGLPAGVHRGAPRRSEAEGREAARGHRPRSKEGRSEAVGLSFGAPGRCSLAFAGRGRGAGVAAVVIAAFATGLAAGAARAQELPLAPVDESVLPDNQLETYVVTANRIREPLSSTPQTVEVLTSEDMQSREQPMIADVLRQATGVQVNQAGEPGSQTSVVIRGSDPDQVLTMIDGIQVNAGTFGAFNYANLVPEPF
ncbi:MAG: TonB-dependent receptor, partial [Alphaproteobacteria bacterium]